MQPCARLMVQNCGPVVYNPHLILIHQQGHSEREKHEDAFRLVGNERRSAAPQKPNVG